MRKIISKVILIHSAIFQQQQQQHGSNVIMFTACIHNGKHEVDLPDTKATAGLRMVIKNTSAKIVRASCILSVKLLKEKDILQDHRRLS